MRQEYSTSVKQAIHDFG